MAEATAISSSQLTVTETIDRDAQARSPNVVLKLRKPKQDKKVQWDEGTVDNEDMNKKKSKCCCIYQKPRMFGESSSDESDSDCTGSCHGHKKKCYQQLPPDKGADSGEQKT